MARKTSVIYAGSFFDALRAEYEKVKSTANPFNRAANTSVPIERKVLDKAESIAVFQKIGKTVLDVFASAGIPLILSEQEQAVLSALEQMDKEQLESVTSCIHQLCDPWWTDILNLGEDTTLSSVARFKRFALHKYPASAEKDFEDRPYLKSIFPFRLVTKIPTDSLPQLCMEAGIPVSFLMDLPIDKVHFYSRNTGADKVFTEYCLIYSEELRKIVERIILKESAKNR